MLKESSRKLAFLSDCQHIFSLIPFSIVKHTSTPSATAVSLTVQAQRDGQPAILCVRRSCKGGAGHVGQAPGFLPSSTSCTASLGNYLVHRWEGSVLFCAENCFPSSLYSESPPTATLPYSSALTFKQKWNRCERKARDGLINKPQGLEHRWFVFFFPLSCHFPLKMEHALSKSNTVSHVQVARIIYFIKVTGNTHKVRLFSNKW